MRTYTINACPHCDGPDYEGHPCHNTQREPNIDWRTRAERAEAERDEARALIAKLDASILRVQEALGLPAGGTDSHGMAAQAEFLRAARDALALQVGVLRGALAGEYGRHGDDCNVMLAWHPGTQSCNCGRGKALATDPPALVAVVRQVMEAAQGLLEEVDYQRSIGNFSAKLSAKERLRTALANPALGTLKP